MKIKEKVTKKDSKKISIFLLIFLFGMITFIVYIPYFREHYPVDVFRILSMGVDDYALLKIAEGRLGLFSIIQFLSALKISLTSLASYFQLYRVFLVISLVLVIIGMLLLYTMIHKRSKNIGSGWKQVVLILCIIAIFLHPKLVDNMLFIENIGMMIALLAAIVAAYYYTKSSVLSKGLAFVILIVGCFFYQGSINFFVPLTYLFHILQHKDEKRSCKQEIGYIVKVLLCYGVVLIINYVFVQVYHHMTPAITEQRLNYSYDLLNNISYIIQNTLHYLVILQCVTLPMILLFGYIKAKQQEQIERKNWIHYYALLILSVISCTVLNLGSVVAFTSRMSFSIGACMGVLGIYLISEITLDSKLEKRVCKGIVSLFAVLLVIQIALVGKEENRNLVATKRNFAVLEQIKEWVLEYEQTSDNRITKVAYYTDQKIDFAYWKGGNSEAAIIPYYYCSWEKPYTLQIQLERPLELVAKQEALAFTFKNRNWIEFSKDQFVLEGDTLHICQF